jgi:hypothetical protein
MHGGDVSVLAQTLEDGSMTEGTVGAEPVVTDVDDDGRTYPDGRALHAPGRSRERRRRGVEVDETPPERSDAAAGQRYDGVPDVSQLACVTDTEEQRPPVGTGMSREAAHDTRLPHLHADSGRAAHHCRVICPMCVGRVCPGGAKSRRCA